MATQPRAIVLTGLRWAAILVQLLLALVLIRAYQLESRTFYNIALLAVVGFVIHAALPRVHRLPFFAGLSVAGVAVAFGVTSGGALLALGLLLIGACHLPIRWGYRVAAVVLLGAVLALGRSDILPLGLNAALWAILGSMFMFRLALYLQAIRQDGFRFSPWRTLAYFFMLPNVVFPLYPVVDYTAFERNHYDRPDLEIYETGVHWMARGLLQLVLYRVVYQFVVTDIAAVVDLTGLLRFLLGTFLLYLRVSGSFHVIVGVLYLFGFRLPETHHLYFLSSGFTDFWRRINIYWKDFMMKLVYYPSFFRLRRWGTERALIAATVIVFLATWLLHSYQWFWLRGGFPLTAQDFLFWGLLGVLVVRASLIEMRKPRARRLSASGWSFARAGRTVATFTVLCILWSLWSAESVVEWLWMWRAALNADAAGLSLLTGLLIAGVLISGRAWGAPRQDGAGRWDWLFKPPVRAAATLLLLVGLAQTNYYDESAPHLAGVMASVRAPTLNTADAELQHRGYYEKLDNPGRMSANLWSVLEERPRDWMNSWDAGLLRDSEDFLIWEMVPSASTQWNGTPVTTNRWGMRDREYDLAKPPRTRRIAILGQSQVMGTYVPDEAVFDNLLEDRLNAEFSVAGLRYEILNFGVTDYSTTQQYGLLQAKVLAFEPDVVLITVADHGRARVARHLLRVAELGFDVAPPPIRPILEALGLEAMARKGFPVPFEPLRTAASRIGVPARMPYQEALARARFAADEINTWAVVESGRLIRQAGAVPVLLRLSNVTDGLDAPPPELEAASEAGFVVMNIVDIYGDVDPRSLRAAPWDNHPNAAAHRLIAERLYDELRNAGLLETPASETAANSVEKRPWTM